LAVERRRSAWCRSRSRDGRRACGIQLKAKDTERLAARIDDCHTKQLHPHIAIGRRMDWQQRVNESRPIGDVEGDHKRRRRVRRGTRRDDGVDDHLIRRVGHGMPVAVGHSGQKQTNARTDVCRPHEFPSGSPPSSSARTVRQRHRQLADRDLADLEAEIGRAPRRHHQVGCEPIGKRRRKRKRPDRFRSQAPRLRRPSDQHKAAHPQSRENSYCQPPNHHHVHRPSLLKITIIHRESTESESILAAQTT